MSASGQAASGACALGMPLPSLPFPSSSRGFLRKQHRSSLASAAVLRFISHCQDVRWRRARSPLGSPDAFLLSSRDLLSRSGGILPLAWHGGVWSPATGAGLGAGSLRPDARSLSDREDILGQEVSGEQKRKPMSRLHPWILKALPWKLKGVQKLKSQPLHQNGLC